MSASDRVPPRSDAMPTTRGTNFYLADPNLELVCATVMRAEDFARALAAAWPQLDSAERELDARPVADALYHALAGALLLAEGQTLWRERKSARKLLVSALYVKKWLRPPTPPASVFTARECEWLDAIADWTPIPAEALSVVAGRL